MATGNGSNGQGPLLPGKPSYIDEGVTLVLNLPPDHTVLIVPTAELRAFVESLAHEYLGPQTEFYNRLVAALGS